MSKKPSKRDAEICRRFKAGESVADIAEWRGRFSSKALDFERIVEEVLREALKRQDRKER